MSEDFPQHPQEEQPRPEGLEPTPIEVVDSIDPTGHDQSELQDSAQDGLVTVPDQIDSTPSDGNRIIDKDLAWDMAHASKPEREVEALHRADIKVAQGALDIKEAREQGASNDDLQTMQEELQPQIDRMKDRAKHAQRYVNNNYIYEARPDIMVDYAESVVRDRRAYGAEDLEHRQRGSEHEANMFRDYADRIEGWVAVLHERPLPETFVASEKITARGLVGIEDQIDIRKTKLERYTKALEEAGSLVGVNGVDVGSPADPRFIQPLDVIRTAYGMSLEREGRFSLVDIELEKFDKLVERMAEIGSPYPEEGVKRLKEYRQAVENPETTLGQLKDMFVDAYEKAYIKPNREFIEQNTALLDQIRTGATSDSDSNTTSQE